MPNYDSKLADWFKQVEKQEQEFKARKKSEESSGRQERTNQPASESASPERPDVGPSPSPRSSAAPNLNRFDAGHVAADARLITRTQAEQADEASGAEVSTPVPELAVPPVNLEEARELFEDGDLEQVDDFLSFINRTHQVGRSDFPQPELTFEENAEASAEQAASEPQGSADQAQTPPREAPPTAEASQNAPTAELPRTFESAAQGPRSLDLCEEGTGEPLPVSEFLKLRSQQGAAVEQPASAQAAAPAPAAQAEPAQVAPETQAAQPEPEVQAPDLSQTSQPEPAVSGAQTPADVQAGWDRMPAHLQMLFSTPANEVAQNSYKTFKETRAELIQRLLDPIISLEEAARILNVCPTTVRRYTNRGVLKHIRTAGNQRRFRLSDVLTFMESNSGRAKKSG